MALRPWRRLVDEGRGRLRLVDSGRRFGGRLVEDGQSRLALFGGGFDDFDRFGPTPACTRLDLDGAWPEVERLDPRSAPARRRILGGGRERRKGLPKLAGGSLRRDRAAPLPLLSQWRGS